MSGRLLLLGNCSCIALIHAIHGVMQNRHSRHPWRSAKALPAWSWHRAYMDVFTASYDGHPGAECMPYLSKHLVKNAYFLPNFLSYYLRRLFRQEFGKLVCRYRMTKIVALEPGTAFTLQKCQLLGRFHTFGNHRQA